VTGASLAQRQRGWSAPQRAVFAARRVQGTAVVTNTTVKTIALEGGVSVASIYVALGLSESEQNAVWQGIRPLKSATAKAVQLDLPLSAAAVTDSADMDDATLTALIAKPGGIERVLKIAAQVEARA
jgi:hypothetical protein